MYEKSNELLERALRVIPCASQTFSKSYLQYPRGSAPVFLKKGKAGRVWDVDDREYVDLVNGLLPVVLGYQDPDVDAAIQEQLHNGISFSLSTELEIVLAEKLIEIIPCAEMVRFGKTGTDATSAAVRLARAFTQKNRIACCGYHGWQDWYIGVTQRRLGVPASVQELTHPFPYNDLEALSHLLEQYPHEFAAIIMEPMHTVDPLPGYLAEVKALAHRHGALFILDEVITGFRFDLGGAQTLFEVTPDLACFGKAMANGMPISAIVGRADVMKMMEDIFFSGTFAGETLSLAASLAVIEKMQREPVIETLWENGSDLTQRVQQLIVKYALQNIISLDGKPPWKVLTFKDSQQIRKEIIRTLFIKEMALHGVLIQSSHNISYAHNQNDFDQIVFAYEKAFIQLRQMLDNKNFNDLLNCPVIEPIFKVR